MNNYVPPDRTLVTWSIAIALAIVLLTWILGSPGWTMRQIGQEAELIASVFGEETSDQVVKNAGNVARHIYHMVTGWLHITNSTAWGIERGQTARLLLTYVGVRLQSVLLIAWMLSPVVLAAVIDGLVQRQIAKEQAAYINPVRFNVGVHLMHGAAGLAPLFIVIPFPMHPMWFAIYWLVFSIGLHLTLKYLHHRI